MSIIVPTPESESTRDPPPRIRHPVTLSLAIFLMACVNAFGTSYYVDYSSGTDGNSGTSTSSPWQHCPGDPSATGNATATVLNPGDTVYFKGGVTYVLTAPYNGYFSGTAGIGLNWSGAAGQPITYDGNSAGTWGTGRAILTDNYSTNQMVAFLTGSGVSNVNFTSLEIGPIGGSAALPADPGYAVPNSPGWGIVIDGSAQNITLANCYFHQLGYWFNQKPMSDADIDGTGFQAINPVNVTVTNCEFTQMSIGCEIVGGTIISNVTIAGCNFHNYLRWCIDLAPTANGTRIDAISIHDSQLHDYDEYDAGLWAGYGSCPHTDGIFDRGDSYSGVYGTNINIYDNFFFSTEYGQGGTAAIYLEGAASAPNANIYNNVFSHPDKSRVIYIYGAPASGGNQVVRIYNNTFLESYLLALNVGGITDTNMLLDLKNNIYYDTYRGSYGNPAVYITDATPPMPRWTMDDDDFETFNLAGALVQWFNVNIWTLGGLQADLGWELHGQFADPDFVSIATQTNGWQSDNFTGADVVDVHLQSSSPCIGAGVNLSSLNLPGLNADKDGNPRPSGMWDLGAYEYNTNYVPPPQGEPGPASVSVVFSNVVQTCTTKATINHVTMTTNTVTTCKVKFSLVASNNGATNFPAFHVLLWMGQGSVFDPSVNPRPVARKVKALRENETVTIRLTGRFNGNQAGSFLYATDTNNNVLASTQIPDPE